MSDKLGYFIDIEIFIKYTFEYEDVFYSEKEQSDEGKLFSNTTKKNWRTYKKFPSEKNLVDLHKYIFEISSDRVIEKENFKSISISELIFCINNAKDHTRGNEKNGYMPITSTGKKLMNVLLLGRLNSDKNYNFICQKSNSDKNMDELYKYLINKNFCSGEQINYYPGRTVSIKQIDKFLSKYENKITYKGIEVGLNQLSEIGLIRIVDSKKNFYKLDFHGCRQFLKKSIK